MADDPLATVAEAIAIACTATVPRTTSYRESIAAAALAVLRAVAEDRALADRVADALDAAAAAPLDEA